MATPAGKDVGPKRRSAEVSGTTFRQGLAPKCDRRHAAILEGIPWRRPTAGRTVAWRLGLAFYKQWFSA